MSSNDDVLDPEITAISVVHGALKGLDSDSQARVLNYVAQKLKVSGVSSQSEPIRSHFQDPPSDGVHEEPKEVPRNDDSDELEGISPVAKKWMTRNGLTATELSKVFSLGIDEIDLIAKTVPGTKKKERMHSVLLLKGVAAYLGTGTARSTHEQIKEAALHYDAFDSSNFAAYLKTMAADVAGSKDGYTLTARGLVNATEMVKALIKDNKVK